MNIYNCHWLNNQYRFLLLEKLMFFTSYFLSHVLLEAWSDRFLNVAVPPPSPFSVLTGCLGWWAAHVQEAPPQTQWYRKVRARVRGLLPFRPSSRPCCWVHWCPQHLISIWLSSLLLSRHLLSTYYMLGTGRSIIWFPSQMGLHLNEFTSEREKDK